MLTLILSVFVCLKLDLQKSITKNFLNKLKIWKYQSLELLCLIAIYTTGTLNWSLDFVYQTIFLFSHWLKAKFSGFWLAVSFWYMTLCTGYWIKINLICSFIKYSELNCRMVDIEIKVWSPLFLNLQIK